MPQTQALAVVLENNILEEKDEKKKNKNKR